VLGILRSDGFFCGLTDERRRLGVSAPPHETLRTSQKCRNVMTILQCKLNVTEAALQTTTYIFQGHYVA
jgi:hypothetical protein